MNEALLKSLQDLAKQAADLETETNAAVKFLDADVNESRREKEVKICEFLDGMAQMLVAVDYPRNKSVDVLWIQLGRKAWRLRFPPTKQRGQYFPPWDSLRAVFSGSR